MNTLFSDKSEYAISSWMYENTDLYDALKDIARHGFRSVELWADTVHFDPRAGIDRNSIKQWLREFNLSVHSVHSPFRNFKTLSDAKDSAEYRQNIWHKTIDDCSDFGVSIMVVHGLDRKEYNYTKDQTGIIRDSLADLCEYGKKRGVMIALENLPGSGKNDDEIVCTLAEHLKNYPGLGLKFCLDIGHAVLNGSDIIDEIHAAGKDLLTFHIHNNDGAADSHNLPLDGIIDWPGLYSYLRNTIGFKDQFVLEVCGGEDPFEVMNSIDALFS